MEQMKACTSSCVEGSGNGSSALGNTANKQSTKNMNIDERMKGFMDLSGTATVVKVILSFTNVRNSKYKL